LGFSASYQVLSGLEVYGVLDNVLDETYLVSSKPYGFRPVSLNLWI